MEGIKIQILGCIFRLHSDAFISGDIQPIDLKIEATCRSGRQ